MARSTYVYVVISDGVPIAAFTVKHELNSWATVNDRYKHYKFYRVKDNPDKYSSEYPIQEIFYPF